MRVDEKIVGEVAVLTLKGEILDADDDSTFQQKIQSLLVDGVRKVIVDMKKVNRINSRGLSSLITAVKTMQKSKGDIRIAGLDDHINDIFVETRLIQAFPTFETVGRAMASYS
jgi:anti-anti-sigma factor